MSIMELGKKAKSASLELQSLSEAIRIQALHAIAEHLLQNKNKILIENQLDLEAAVIHKLSPALVDRLKLTEKNIESLAKMCHEVAGQAQVVGLITEKHTRADGLVIERQRIPLGVIGMIFESRPNVVVDGAALAIKSGNAIILKGGKEAQKSNRILFDVMEKAIHGILPKGSLSLVETREDVAQLLKLHQYIDLMVPRGGSQLVNFVRQNATMPVVAHDKGLCHTYVHFDADQLKVIPILLNAKTQKPSACNSLESLLLHEHYPENKKVIEALLKAGVEVRGCARTMMLSSEVKLATLDDYDTEYLDNILSVKVVSSFEEALTHILKHSSHHTEAILAKDSKVIETFLNSLDASAMIVNASTRFNDGSELGLGAELGISTSKLHAYGPMGTKEMTTTRFLVKGDGHTRK
jgi:glutamate-5-semialdehyde dehydrogenase